MKKLLKIAANLKLKGFNRLAADVLDLFQRKKERDKRRSNNEKVLRDLQEEDRMSSILKQHEEDKRNFLMPESQISIPEGVLESRSYVVHVSYPSFDEAGLPYFDSNSVQEKLSMTEAELEDHKRQEEQGYLKILSIDSVVPRSK